MVEISKANIIYIAENDVMVFEGTPDYFVQEEDFFLLRTRPDAREALLKQLGVPFVTIGRLGINKGDGLFFLPEDKPSEVNTTQRRAIGEYLRLRGNDTRV